MSNNTRNFNHIDHWAIALAPACSENKNYSRIRPESKHHVIDGQFIWPSMLDNSGPGLPGNTVDSPETGLREASAG